MYKDIAELLYQTPQQVSAADWNAKKESIKAYIAELINRDFNQLVNLLYRLDISETKLKSLLSQTPTVDSAALITDIIIERQLQKLNARQTYKPDTDIADEERW
jgi:hypothetical protein